ncbi:hypothetical protein HOI26_05910 [Candidatus Woesearchaeota archaeon]|jgi:protein-S-isoprenylcysteine O-methyltransferase Ste14|nr:hypothetical protein [Candidatus Woesearchaeota archaeon]MBT4935992.1 hypothetical protein [Candidatus Woesearchaeota archaeon]MBT5740603.1 hypothetical protein [Candidatus Woesearchaeota archaeon]
MTSLLKRGLALYLSSALIYGLGVLLFQKIAYYQNMLSKETQITLLFLYIAYVIIAPVYYLATLTRYSTNKPYIFLKNIKKNIQNITTKNKLELLQEEKVAILFLGVKLFFLPLMINFFIGNFKHLGYILNNQFMLYPFVLTLIFTLDTLIFTFGYAIEFKPLKNVVKSVEPTFFGWFVALISYPPFNSITGSRIPWGANDHVFFWTSTGTTIFHIIIILLLGVYLWATFALGPKASNLTNRGIVTKFPYSIVRHPAYICKNLVWWITLIPVMSWQFALGMGFWSMIYFFRAFTEERHLSQDEEYKKYKKKVKWKFIPKLI